LKIADLKIAAHLSEERKERSIVNEILLFGPPRSGKSTVLRRAKLLSDQSFSGEELAGYRNVIQRSVFNVFKQLVQKADIGSHSVKLAESKQAVLEYRLEDVSLDVKIAVHIERLWKDLGIQAVYEKHKREEPFFDELGEHADYFINRALLILRPDFVPSSLDVVRARIRTPSVAEQRFNVERNIFCMINPGQRSPAKHWIRFFSNVRTVLLVVSLNTFDQVAEDGKNCMIKDMN